MLSGEVAFSRDSAVETMNAILHEDPRDLSAVNEAVPASVDRIIHRCLAKQPEQRFQSARDLAFALRNSSDSSVRTVGAIESPEPVKKPSPVQLLLGGVALLAIGLLVGVTLGGRTPTAAIPEPVKIYPFTHSG